MRERVPVGAVVIVALGFIAAVVGPITLLLFVAVVAVATAGELYRVARARGARPITIVGLLAVVGALVAVRASDRNESALPVVVAAALIATFAMSIAQRKRANVTSALIFTLLPVVVVGLLAAYVIALRELNDGFRLVVALGLVAVAADLGAMFVASRAPDPQARAWWRRLLGALGGASLGAIIAALTLSPPITWARAIVLAIVVALAVTVADAVAKMIEEDLAARAQMLRRVDAVLFSAPVFFYTYQVLAG